MILRRDNLSRRSSSRAASARDGFQPAQKLLPVDVLSMPNSVEDHVLADDVIADSGVVSNRLIASRILSWIERGSRSRSRVKLGVRRTVKRAGIAQPARRVSLTFR